MNVHKGMRFEAVKTGAVFTVDEVVASLDLEHGLAYAEIEGHWQDGQSGRMMGAPLARDIIRGDLIVKGEGDG